MYKTFPRKKIAFPLMLESCFPINYRIGWFGIHIEAYGKGVIVGTNCEIEHGSALIHTLLLGNFYREVVKATCLLVILVGPQIAS